MKINRKRIVAVLAMALMCIFMTSAMAAVAQPDKAWMAEHLLTSLPAEDGAELLPLADATAKQSATGLTLEAKPAATLGKNVDCTVTLNLILEGEGDATPTWTLDMAAPLTLNDVKAKAASEDLEEITPPSEQELAALVEISGLCAHGETALKLKGITYAVTAYKDENGASRAALTIAPKAVAAAATRVLDNVHGADQINKLKAVYTLVEADGAWTLTGIKVKFALACGEEKCTVTYDDGCKGQAFPRERYKVIEGEATPKCTVDFTDPDAVRAGYRFVGWDKEISATVKGNATYTAQWIKLHTVVYCDGADGAAFPTETYTVEDGAATPACTVDISDPEAMREGYRFVGWDKPISETVKGDTTYTAQWVQQYTITYENVPEDVENSNPVSYEEGDTPITLADLDCEGFVGWLNEEGNDITEIEQGATGDLVITAYIVSRPSYPKDGHNISESLYKVQCTVHEEHAITHNAFVELNTSKPENNDLAWNDASKRWEVTVTIALNRYINLTNTRGQYFGNLYHYWYDKEGKVTRSNGPKIKLYWAPDAEGSTSLGEPVTGLWYAVDGNPVVLDVFCYDEPVAPKGDKNLSVSGGLWLRNCYNTSKWTRYTSLPAGTYTVGEMTKHDDGKFYVPVTVTPDEAVAAYQKKYGSEYVICDDADTHGEQATSYTFMFKYTGSTTDYYQDGKYNNWSFDATATIALGAGYAKRDGYTIWMSRSFDVTYVDGVEDEVVFEDKTFTVREGADTPAFDGEPTRVGYRFLGWDPEVAQKVTADATYTAQWEQVYAITYENVPEGVENSNPVAYGVDDTPITLAALDCDGFLGWLDAESNAITEIAQGTTGDLVITAKIVSKPGYPRDGHNISENLYTIQCTTDASHTYTHNAQLNVNAWLNDLAWNEAAQRWEVTAEIKFNNFINNRTVSGAHFGGFKHHWNLGTGADKNPKIKLYWAPDAQGSTSLGAPVTGLWYAVDGNPVVLEVFCYDKPAALTEEKLAKLSGKFYRIQDFTNITVNVMFKSLKAGTYTIGEVYGSAADGWKIDVTVTDLEAYYADFLAKCTDGATYVIAPDESNTKATWTFKYKTPTSIPIDYQQDKWSLDTTIGGPNYDTQKESMNGRYINFYPTWQTTYTDGVDEEEIFADQVYADQQEGDALPQFVGDVPTRTGYEFAGWLPELTDTVPAEDVTFVAQWKQHCTVTYTDGKDGSIFADETYADVLEGDSTPECVAVKDKDPDTFIEGYRFMGWEPEWSETVTGTVTYTAKFAKLYTVTYFDWWDQKVLAEFVVPEGEPTPEVDYNDYTKGSYVNLGWTTEIAPTVTEDVTYTMMQMVPPRDSNIVGLNVVFDCEVEDKHDNSGYTWFTKGYMLRASDGDVSYDAAQDKYVGTVTIKEDLSKLLASYGKHEHELVSVSQKTFTVTFDMEKKNWVSDIDAITVTARCPEAPAITAATDKAITTAKVRMLDVKTGKKKWYNRPLVVGTYTVGEMRGSRAEGGWYFDVTVTDFAPYLEQYQAKYGMNYAVNEEQTGTLVFTFKYAYNANGSTVVKTDGTGWKWDTTGLSTMDKNNGKPIFMDDLYTVTYSDGVEDTVIFEDKTYFAREGADTPAFDGVPTREGYVFTGWTPALSETVAGDVTYVATWAKGFTVTYSDGADGAVFETQTYDVTENSATPVFNGVPTREGYDFDGWTPEVAETVTEDVTYVAVWTKLWNVTYTDGVEGEVVFEDQSYTVRDGDKTPAYVGAPFAREGFLFKGWSPAWADTVTADVVYVAVWTVNDTGLSVPDEPVVKDDPVAPETPAEEPTEPEMPVENPTAPEPPVEEPTEPETPVENPTTPEPPVEEPTPEDEGVTSPTDIP